MKKIILTTVVILTFGFVNAQDKKEMSFGIKGGLNISSITNVSGLNTSSLIGFHVGVFGEFMLGDEFAIQPELLYSTQGTRLDDGVSKEDFKLGYINIPVMVKYYVADAFSLELGPQIGFLVSAKSGGVDVKDLVEKTDFGLNFGAGYDFVENMTLGIRYNLGLTKIQKSLDLFPGESKNSVFSFSFGYKF